MNKIKFSDLKDGMNIFVPKDLLKFVAENHPDEPIIVTDVDDLQTYVIEQLQGNLYDQESGLTLLEQLIDNAITEAVCSGDDSFAHFKEDDN